MRDRQGGVNPAKQTQRDRGHCGRYGCRCTHTEGCDHGWIELPPVTNDATGVVYRLVEPCPQCRPESYERLLMKGIT